MKTAPTAFSRFLIVVILMAAIFFGVKYFLTQTDSGKELHQDLQHQVESSEQ